MRHRLGMAIVAAAAFLTSVAANGEYNANIQGKIDSVRVYDSGLVLIHLDVQPSSHPACNPAYFGIDSGLESSIRAQLLSRALVAKSSGETINIGYDNLANCANGWIRIYEIGW